MIKEENTLKNLTDPTSAPDLKISKYDLLTKIYFFFNSVLLPKGLLFTNIFSPLFYFNVIKQKRRTFWLPFFSFLLFYDCCHLIIGVDVKAFVISNLYFTSCYFAVVSIYHFINNYHKLSLLYKNIVLLNFLLAIIAIPFFFMQPVYQDIFWWVNRAAMSKNEFPRLKLFTYEASYYSTLLVPIVYFYSLKFLFGEIKHHKVLTAIMVFLPLIMSMSFGVLGASCIAAVFMLIWLRKDLLKYKRTFNIIGISLISILSITIILILSNPDHQLVKRLYSIFEGTDTSARGRTSDSFGMAWSLISDKGRLFGIGLGQIKLLIEEQVRAHYSYWGNYPRYDIPNAVAETMAIFGITGVVLRLFLQWFLFFKTKTYSNYYRLALFLFIFIYQFTGSFITNIAEYMVWILAFSNVFNEFDRNKQHNVSSATLKS